MPSSSAVLPTLFLPVIRFTRRNPLTSVCSKPRKFSSVIERSTGETLARHRRAADRGPKDRPHDWTGVSVPGAAGVAAWADLPRRYFFTNSSTSAHFTRSSGCAPLCSRTRFTASRSTFIKIAVLGLAGRIGTGQYLLEDARTRGEVLGVREVGEDVGRAVLELEHVVVLAEVGGHLVHDGAAAGQRLQQLLRRLRSERHLQLHGDEVDEFSRGRHLRPPAAFAVARAAVDRALVACLPFAAARPAFLVAMPRTPLSAQQEDSSSSGDRSLTS